ncbi:MAG: ATP-binding protein [Pseudomonadota bacterium]
MGAKIRAFDWAASPLGSIETWSPALRITVSLVLASHFPKCLLWGTGLVVLYNDAFRPLLGAKPEALGRAFSEIWSETWDVLEPIVARAFAGEATFIEDFPLRINRNGSFEQAFFTFCYSPVHDESGAIVGMIDTVIETTGKVLAERRSQEDRLHQVQRNASLERRVVERTRALDRIWQHSRDLMVVIGKDGLLRAVSPAWSATLGHPVSEMLGQSFDAFVHPEDAEVTRQALERVEPQGLPAGFENRCLHRDGSVHWISWYTSVEPPLVYAFGRDISEEKVRAASLAQAEDQLRQAQKMEAVGQLTGGLAHDFNNLLAGISGSLELLQNRLSQGRVADLQRYIATAQGAAARAATLTHRLLAFSRRQTLDPKATNVNRLIAGLEELLRRTVGPAIALQVINNEPVCNVRVDPNQLESALLNLCINARDAMPEGGRLLIETRPRHLGIQEAAALDLPPGPYLVLSVGDTGTGMATQVSERAFDPFFTTKPIGQGTGLGLSMVYGFARQSGGQVRIDSDLGQGTTVSLFLPGHDQAEEPLPDALPSAESARAVQDETVLLIDDEASVRMLVREVLEDLGYRVIEAADSLAGLAILQSAVHLDLLISDVGLPGGMNGRQLADAGRASRPGLRVLLITGYADNARVGDGQLPAGMQVLTKPFSVAALADRIGLLFTQF